MTSAPAESHTLPPHAPQNGTIALHRASPRDDDVHTGTAYAERVRRGEAVRLRRGVYTSAQSWKDAAPWQRHAAAVAATALQHPTGIFCRESALLLHSVPLLHTPAAVHLRTYDRTVVGTRPAPPPFGRSPGPSARETVPDGVPTRLIEPARYKGHRRDELRRRIGDGEWENPSTSLPAETLPGISGVERPYRVEPLGLASADTVPRLAVTDAVVILDSLLAGRCRGGPWNIAQLRRWETHISSTRLMNRWSQALALTDARAESVGESVLRIRMHQLGFRPPALQSLISTGERTYRVDFEWREAGVVVEFDGRVKYRTPRADSPGVPDAGVGSAPEQTVWAEKLREDAIRSTGRRVVRVVWSDLVDRSRLERLLLAAGIPR